MQMREYECKFPEKKAEGMEERKRYSFTPVTSRMDGAGAKLFWNFGRAAVSDDGVE